jgi:anti-sigma factor RsiW
VRHVTDEDLLLDYYDEGSPTDRARVRSHLGACDRCRALDHELRAVLSAVESTPLSEPPSGFEREIWARIEPLLPVQGARRWPRSMMPGWALAAGIAALIVGAFTAGRLWDQRVGLIPEETANTSSAGQRLLDSEVEDHFERSQRVLVELTNTDFATSGPNGADRERAADLVAAGRLYRQSAEDIGDPATGELLEDLERVLVEVANGPTDIAPEDVARLRERINDQDLLFRLRVITAEMRERERRARPTW